ncbi:MAG: hypothetical protein ABR502_06640 [Chitinophagaceae bacterium]
MIFIEDLITEGWIINSLDFDNGLAIASGKPIPIKNIRGIINFIPGIQENDLDQINQEDRLYAVQELNAFFTYFLYQINVPVINSLVPRTNSKTFRRIEEIIIQCHILGIPVKERNYLSKSYQPLHGPHQETSSVFIVGNEYLGEKEVISKQKIVALSRWLGVDFIEVIFVKENSDYFFQHVNYLPDFSNTSIMERIFHFLNSTN